MTAGNKRSSSRRKAAGRDEVRLRLLRNNDIPPTNPHEFSYLFGLQDRKQNIIAGRRQPSGALAFDFTLTVKKGKNPKYPVFTGAFASGPADDRFVYLSWRSIERGDYINRVKARLSTIEWKMVRAAQEKDSPLTADMTGWTPGDPRKHVSWRLG